MRILNANVVKVSLVCFRSYICIKIELKICQIRVFLRGYLFANIFRLTEFGNALNVK